MFDAYSLKARFYPIIILFFPIIILGLFYSFEFKSLLHLLSSVGLVGALTYLFSQLGRDQGKLKESGLWESWGGTPTTQLLRIKDVRIDKHTKTRYHQKLQTICPVPVIPDLSMEENAPDKADEVYKAWTKYLISKTRDTKAFQLLFKDNISYGFRRNLWGLKPHAFIVILALIICNYIFSVINNKSWNPFLLSKNFQYSTLTLFIIFIFWLLVVRKSWVRIPAFSYAERLCEATENID